MRATPPVNEAERLAALRSYDVLDTAPEPEFDGLTRLAAAVCQTPIATLTLVDEQRQWFKSRVGLDLSETHRDLAFCAHAILQRDVFVVPDALQDERFADNDLVTNAPSLRFYAGVPLVTAHDFALGTLAVMDYVPRQLTETQRQALVTIAQQAYEQMELRRQLLAQRKRIDDVLVEGEMLRRIAGRLARLGGWVVDIGADRVHWSDEVCAIHEVPPGTSPSLEEGIRYYAPEWREPIRTVLAACMRDGTPFDEEMQIITAGGRRMWVRTVGEAVRNERGNIVRLQGAFQNITEKKRAEQEVRQLASRLTTTLESITDAFYTLDREWRFTYLNREAERLLERNRGELLGAIVWEAFPDALGTPIELEYRRAVSENHTVSFEEFYPPLDRWFEIHAFPSREGLAVYFRDITERKRAEDEIQFLALYDPLTGLPNRRLLRDRVQHAFAASARNHKQGALLFIDLDDFKTLNDTLGHQEGDRLLQQVAFRVSSCLREGDTVARFGGDEFVVVLTELSESRGDAAVQAESVGEKIRAAVNRPYSLTHHQRHVTSSIGITLFAGQEDTVDDVMKRADLALYRAKAAGRNTLRLFDPAMQSAIHARVALEAELRDGLRRSEFVPYYQPQYDNDWRLTGAEALVRWRHPRRGLVEPEDFVPLAEETGLILEVGRGMLDAACAQLAAWAQRPETTHLCLSVNISAREFHHPNFVAGVLAALERTGANPERLRLELTETLLLEDVEDTIRKMSALKHQGVSFSLDDFGTGYSSLYYLKRLPLDQLKIDQSFVRDVLTDSNDAAIVRSVVGLSQNLGLAPIAEGVETEEVRDFLAHHGCCAYQGYLFSRPLPIEEFEELIREESERVDG